MLPESWRDKRGLAFTTKDPDIMRKIRKTGDMRLLRVLASNPNMDDDCALSLILIENTAVEENLLLNDSVSADVIRTIHEQFVGKHDYLVATAANTPKDILIQIACDNRDEEASVEARKRLDVLDLID